MLLHKIEPHKPPSYSPVVYRGYTADAWPNYPIHTKIGYAQYLKGLIHGTGDYLVRKNAIFPYDDQDLYIVLEVQEVVWLAKIEDGKAACLFLRNFMGMEFWAFPEEFNCTMLTPTTAHWGKCSEERL